MTCFCQIGLSPLKGGGRERYGFNKLGSKLLFLGFWQDPERFLPNKIKILFAKCATGSSLSKQKKNFFEANICRLCSDFLWIWKHLYLYRLSLKASKQIARFIDVLSFMPNSLFTIEFVKQYKMKHSGYIPTVGNKYSFL